MEVVKTVLGFADAISFIIRYAYSFCSDILPANISTMFGIAFTVIVALSIKRSVVT